jgi:hypothetical protein
MDRPTVSGTTNLIDILDRVLDKGLVVAGDIRVSLANVELLTIRIRLLVCSVDKAEQIGLNWWKFDPNLTQQVSAPTNRMGLPPGSRMRQQRVTQRTTTRATLDAPTPIRQKSRGVATSTGTKKIKKTSKTGKKSGKRS